MSEAKLTLDDNIVALLLNGNEEGLRILYRNYSSAIYGIIYRIVASQQEADEILNDTFLKIYKNISAYEKDKSKLFTWMARIARNAAIDKVRSAGFNKSKQTSSLDIQDNSSRFFEMSSSADFGMQKLIGRMDEDLRQILDYVYFQGYSHQDCADALCLPLGTVKTKVRRAILFLREELKDDMPHLLSIFLLLSLLVYTYKMIGQ
jgi:RNA polymerase sigma-70 factor (ECF subfamily)